MYSQCPKCQKAELEAEDIPPAVGPGELPPEFGTIQGMSASSAGMAAGNGACPAGACGCSFPAAGFGTQTSNWHFTLTPQDVKSIADGTCKTEGELPFGEIVEAHL